MSTVQLIHADVVDGLRSLPDASVHVVCTSPPYFALRRYQDAVPRTWADGSQCVFGEEPNVYVYVEHLAEIFEEVKRVLHPSGTLWLNLGDSYQHGGPQPSTGIHKRNGVPLPETYKRQQVFKSKKQLGMIPARAAIALQDRDWILRQHIVWAKGLSFLKCYSGSVMPESIVDRATWSWESLFHFSKENAYYYDINGCREPYAESTRLEAATTYEGQATKDYAEAGAQNPSDVKRRVLASVTRGGGRNLRNVWVIPKEPFRFTSESGVSHFAVWPTKLVEPIVKLGTSEKGCCPQCLNPWERNLIKEPVPAEVQEAFNRSRISTEADLGRGDGYTHRKPNYRRRILGEGWRPTCSCDAGEPIPCTVADIFSGSGRAGVVAKRLGRNFIGIDASEQYCKIAEKLIGEVV